MSTVNINIRMDESLKKQFEATLDAIGMNLTTGINVFAKAVVRDNRIPFELRGDPFFSEVNQAYLRKVIADFESGKVTPVTKTMAELEAMADE